MLYYDLCYWQKSVLTSVGLRLLPLLLLLLPLSRLIVSVIAINSILIIIISTRLLLLPLLAVLFINIRMSTHPVAFTITTSIITNM